MLVEGGACNISVLGLEASLDVFWRSGTKMSLVYASLGASTVGPSIFEPEASFMCEPNMTIPKQETSLKQRFESKQIPQM